MFGCFLWGLALLPHPSLFDFAGANLLRDKLPADERSALAGAALAGLERRATVFQRLVECSKAPALGTRAVLLATIKGARAFLAHFLKTGMPLLDRHFVAHRERVLTLLQTLQLSTRFLQRACQHSKDVSKDPSLMAQVPALKRCLEAVVFRTKAMLALHNCAGAFWLGALKNRDLQGNVVSSQLVPDDGDDDDDGNGGDGGDGEDGGGDNGHAGGRAPPAGGPARKRKAPAKAPAAKAKAPAAKAKAPGGGGGSSDADNADDADDGALGDGSEDDNDDDDDGSPIRNGGGGGGGNDSDDDDEEEEDEDDENEQSDDGVDDEDEADEA